MAQQFNAAVWSALKLKSLEMTGDPISKENKNRPKLKVGISAETGRPAFTIYTNDGTDAKPIYVQLDPATFFTLMQAITDATNSTEPYHVILDINTRFSGKQRLEKPIIAASINVVRNANGAIILVFVHKGTKVPFTFTSSYPNRLRNGVGEAADIAIVSRLAALAWVKLIGDIVTAITATIKEPPAREGGSAYTPTPPDAPSAPAFVDFDEDLPY